MAEIINLRLARKTKARTAAASVAASNRAKHGQSKAERIRQQAEAARADRLLSGARREPD